MYSRDNGLAKPEPLTLAALAGRIPSGSSVAQYFTRVPVLSVSLVFASSSKKTAPGMEGRAADHWTSEVRAVVSLKFDRKDIVAALKLSGAEQGKLPSIGVPADGGGVAYEKERKVREPPAVFVAKDAGADSNGESSGDGPERRACPHLDCEGQKWKLYAPSSLRRHTRLTHSDEPLFRYVCTFEGCGQTFGRSDHFAEHLRRHTAPKLVCTFCSYETARRQELDKHLEKHLVQALQEKIDTQSAQHTGLAFAYEQLEEAHERLAEEYDRLLEGYKQKCEDVETLMSAVKGLRGELAGAWTSAAAAVTQAARLHVGKEAEAATAKRSRQDD